MWYTKHLSTRHILPADAALTLWDCAEFMIKQAHDSARIKLSRGEDVASLPDRASVHVLARSSLTSSNINIQPLVLFRELVDFPIFKRLHFRCLFRDLDSPKVIRSLTRGFHSSSYNTWDQPSRRLRAIMAPKVTVFAYHGSDLQCHRKPSIIYEIIEVILSESARTHGWPLDTSSTSQPSFF